MTALSVRSASSRADFYEFNFKLCVMKKSLRISAHLLLPSLLCCVAIFFNSCDLRLNQALERAGSNRMELEKVLEHFESEKDGFKYEAARFLIENMPFHSTCVGPATRLYDSLYLKTAMEPLNDRTNYFNRHAMAVDDSQTRMVADITAVRAGYLIKMINYACDVWRNMGWNREYDKTVFFEYVLPYRLNNELLSDWHEGIEEEFPLLKKNDIITRRGLQYEAENGHLLSSGIKEADGASCHRCATLCSVQSEVAFNVVSNNDAKKRLIMRYATMAQNLTALLKVNGEVIDTLNLAKTRNMDTFVEKWFNKAFNIKKGANVVTLCNPSGLLDLDYVQFSSVEPYPDRGQTDFSTDYYYVSNKQTHNYITFDFSQGSKLSGIELYPLSESDSTQLLRLDYQGYLLWKIHSCIKDSIDRCLEVKFGTPETLCPYSVVSQGYSVLRPFQNWAIIPVGGGYFRIMNKHTGMYLDSEKDMQSGVEYLVQAPYSEEDTQKWCFEKCGGREHSNPVYSIGSAISEAIRVYDVAHQFEFYTNNGLLSPKGYTLFKAKSGKCLDEADFSIYLCRHLGIPAAEDFAPQWGNRSQGHSWSVIIKPDGKSVTFYAGNVPGDTVHYFHPYKKPKVFRRCFSLNRKMAEDMEGETEVPVLFQNPRYTDVTEEYCPISDVTMNVPCDFVENHRLAYICVFDNHNWVPVYYGRIKGGKVTFKSMGRDIVYMAAVYENGQIVPFGDPFLLKKDGKIMSLKADIHKCQTMELVRKYPFMGAEDFFNFRMDGGQFQGSNHSDFSDSTVFYIHKGITDGNWYDIPVKDDRTYKYLRYIGGKGSYCNINELVFFDKGGKKVIGEIIGSEGEAWARKENVFDGNILTGFCAKSPDGNWVGLKLPSGTRISRLRFIPRNDGNCIEVGDDYVLYCWMESRWKELVHQKAKGNELCLTGIPSGGLYLLKDLTKGSEERIFSYENGLQVWW